MSFKDRCNRFIEGCKSALNSPQLIAFFPALILAAYWFGGESALIGAAILLPVWVILTRGISTAPPRDYPAARHFHTLMPREMFDRLSQNTLEQTQQSVENSCLYHIVIDDFSALLELHGQSAGETVMTQLGERILTVLRDDDSATRYGDCKLAVCLGPNRNIDLEASIQLAGRIQAIMEEPIVLDGLSIYITSTIGFCLANRSPEENAAQWSQAAAQALIEAQKYGPASLRAYTEEMRRVSQVRSELRDEVSNALETGQIIPWFQPQISTDTGEVSGFEALARWFHPERGMISPADFLPAIEQCGLLERLAEVMMYHSFTALKAWDSAQLFIPHVGVNFSGAELNNPRLVEKIDWELDRFDLSADRLAVEILETVISNTPDDQVSRNINNLMDLGCHIDLDDFGTGHASISAIRRFRIDRLKIDRSFVMKVDRDPEQQRMISAIITMAERLNLATLAEGVETPGEHALLSQLGCDFVQGFGIAKPMPFQDTISWIRAHNAQLPAPPKIAGGRSS